MQEIISKRGKNSKTYDIGNGQNKIEIFQYPLHYDGANGWEDIDTNIEFEAGFGHKIKKANFNIRFDKKILRFGFAKNVYIEYTLPTENRTVTGNRCLFEDAWTQTDLEYLVESEGVKNNIILKDNTAPTIFNFPISVNDCTLEVANNAISIMADNMIVGNIPAPYALDANGDMGNVVISYTNSIITFTTDQTWLSTAVYPVIIDPSTFQVGASTSDGYVYDSSISRTGVDMIVGNTYTPCNLYALFTSINIAKGVSVSEAHVEYLSNTTITGSNPLTRIFLEAADNPSAPNTKGNYDFRTMTTAYVDWTMPNTTNGSWYNSPNISTVVQEIVNRTGWASGNAMQVFHKDNGSTSNYSRNIRTYNYDSVSGPKLVVTYSTGDDETVVPSIGTATSDGLTSVTTLNVNISTAPSTGTATSVGLTSTVSLVNNLTVNLSIGTATSNGNPCEVSSPIDIGTSVSSGLASTVTLTMNLILTPSVGTSDSIGLACEISAPIELGTATSEGLAATVSTNSGTIINADVGTALAIGLDTIISIGGNATVSASTGTATSNGLSATVSVSSGLQVDCSIGDSDSIGLVSTVTNQTQQVLNPSIGLASSDGFNSNISISNTVNISPSIGASISNGLNSTTSINVNSLPSIGIATSTGLNSTTTNNTTIIINSEIGTALSRGNNPIVTSSTEVVVATKKLNQRIKLGLGLGL